MAQSARRWITLPFSLSFRNHALRILLQSDRYLSFRAARRSGKTPSRKLHRLERLQPCANFRAKRCHRDLSRHVHKSLQFLQRLFQQGSGALWIPPLKMMEGRS